MFNLLHAAGVFSAVANDAGCCNSGLSEPLGVGIRRLPPNLQVSAQLDLCCMSGPKAGRDPRAARGHREAVYLLQQHTGNMQPRAGAAAGMKHSERKKKKKC